MKIKDRMDIFIAGFRLVNYEGSWWIERADAYGSSVMVSAEEEGDASKRGRKAGYFKSWRAACDSFIRKSSEAPR